MAAIASAKRRENVDRCFIGESAGGTGQSLYPSHLAAVYGYNHSFIDPNLFHNEDELRKQLEGLAQSFIVTAQETPQTAKTFQQDLYKKLVSADDLSGRRPYGGYMTRMMRATGWKRMEANHIMSFRNVLEQNLKASTPTQLRFTSAWWSRFAAAKCEGQKECWTELIDKNLLIPTIPSCNKVQYLHVIISEKTLDSVCSRVQLPGATALREEIHARCLWDYLDGRPARESNLEIMLQVRRSILKPLPKRQGRRAEHLADAISQLQDSVKKLQSEEDAARNLQAAVESQMHLNSFQASGGTPHRRRRLQGKSSSLQGLGAAFQYVPETLPQDITCKYKTEGFRGRRYAAGPGSQHLS